MTPQQALLYRLCGDRNPLHADPDFAKAAGFPAPILHGLCSYGIVLRELTDALLGGDADRGRRLRRRFAGVVFPGETIRVRGWREDGRIVASAAIAGGDATAPPCSPTACSARLSDPCGAAPPSTRRARVPRSPINPRPAPDLRHDPGVRRKRPGHARRLTASRDGVGVRHRVT